MPLNRAERAPPNHHRPHKGMCMPSSLTTLLAQFDYASWPRFPKREPHCRKKLLTRTSMESWPYGMARQWIDKTLANIPVPEGDAYALLPRVESVCLAELDHLLGTSLLAGRWPQTEYRRYPLLYWQLVRYYQMELYRSKQSGQLQPDAGFKFHRIAPEYSRSATRTGGLKKISR